MKKFILGITLCLLATFAFAQNEIAFEGKSFGEGVKKGNVISTEAIATKLGDSTKANMKVLGEVVSVCQSKGCFMNLAMPNGETLYVNFKDYSFFMPKDIAGKKIVMEGFAERKITSVEDLKHYAEDAKKSPAEIAKITKPKNEIVFEAKGVVILD